MLTNYHLQFRTCYFEGDTPRSMLAEFLGFLKEKENASSKIIFSFEQLQPSTSPPFYYWCVK